MALTREKVSIWTKEGALALLMIVQAGCASFFVADVIDDISDAGKFTLHLDTELFANLGLLAAIVVEARVLWALLRRQALADRTIKAARGAMAELLEDNFRRWGLTASEADIASFTIKGFSIAETAELRGSSEATVKSHLNAVYRKAGVTGRTQLIAVFVEELFDGPIKPGEEAPAARG